MAIPAPFPQQPRCRLRPGLFVPGLAQGAMAPDADGPFLPGGRNEAVHLRDPLNEPVTSTPLPEAVNSIIPSC